MYSEDVQLVREIAREEIEAALRRYKLIPERIEPFPVPVEPKPPATSGVLEDNTFTNTPE